MFLCSSFYNIVQQAVFFKQASRIFRGSGEPDGRHWLRKKPNLKIVRARFGKNLSYIRVKDENPVRQYIWFFMQDGVDICGKMCYFKNGNPKKGFCFEKFEIT